MQISVIVEFVKYSPIHCVSLKFPDESEPPVHSHLHSLKAVISELRSLSCL